MEKELDQEVIKATQTSLGKYVKRPPLTEKLLKKPPFRFLHDIITTVLKTTGFFEGLFEEDELISDNVKDREGKILFLTKAISVLGLATGQNLSVKPSKVVAGQEPDKTNEFLQCLAQALDEKLSSDEAVRKFKEKGNSPPTIEKKPKESVKTVKKSNDAKKLTSKSTDKLISQKRDSTEKLPRNEKDKGNDNKKKKDAATTRSDITKKTQPTKTSSKKPQVEIKAAPTEEHKIAPKDEIKIEKLNKPNLHVSNDKQIDSIEFDEKKTSDPRNFENNHVNEVNKASPEELTQKLDHDEQGKLDLSFTIAENDLNSSLSSQDLMETEKTEPKKNIEKYADTNIKAVYNEPPHQEKNTDLVSTNPTESLNIVKHSLKKDSSASNSFDSETVNKSGDLPSSEATTNSSTSIKSKANIIRPPSVRPSSSRPGAPRLREKLDNVVTDNDNLLLGKVNIIAESDQNDEEEDTSVIIVEKPTDNSTLQDQQELQLSSNEHGHLVQQILDSQKEFSQVLGKTEIEWQFGAQKAREALNQEIEQLRFNIQALSRVANPLGKLLDHIQEDVEVMRQELHQWTTNYDQVTKEILKQKTINEESLFPLHTKLKQIGADIQEKYDKINDLKILIHKNSSRIEKLLASGNVQ